MPYHNILIALDLSDEAKLVLERGQEIARQFSAGLKLIHVVEPILPAPPYELPSVSPLEMEQELSQQARRRLQELAQSVGIDTEDVVIETGSTTTCIVDFAVEQKADLIVIGSHGRHGVGLLLGSTANSVLHHTRVDVLAVRVGQ
ncbi:MAG: universal stress protein [Gammaproteobacteria bacterium]|nr:universal stress protein [Gammaproteobacteria bacterium]